MEKIVQRRLKILMVSIKKKSHRQPARLRYGIQKKVSAYRKKQRKEEKKNPQRRKRKGKDPGIPNSFPYKDKILEEIQAERKFKLKKTEKNKSIEKKTFNSIEELAEHARIRQNEFDGVIQNDPCEIEDEIESWYGFSENENEDQKMGCIKKENSLKAFRKTFKEVIDASDIILYILDARNPEETRSRQIEKMILQDPEKKMVFILNKIDLVPYNNLMEWLTFLRAFFPCLPFQASSYSSHSFNNTPIKSHSTALNVIKFLKSYSHKQNLKRPISVGIIGYPNVGKSSIINTLVSCLSGSGTKKPCTTGSEAGITTSIKQVKLDDKIKLIDSPGIIFPSKGNINQHVSEEKVEDQAKLILINAISPSNITDPIYVVSQILNRLHPDPVLYEKIKEFYQLPPILSVKNDITTDFLVHVARKRGRLGKGGVPHLESAAKSIINDWCSGKIQWWTNVPKNNTITTNGSLSTTDDLIFATEWAKEFDLNTIDVLIKDN